MKRPFRSVGVLVLVLICSKAAGDGKLVAWVAMSLIISWHYISLLTSTCGKKSLQDVSSTVLEIINALTVVLLRTSQSGTAVEAGLAWS